MRATAAADRPITKPASLWRDPSFAAFWAAQTVSSVGTQISLVALPLVAVLTLDVDAASLGVLRFAEYLPFLLFTLLFGVWADRWRRRPLMIASNAARAVLIGLVPLATALGLLELPLLVVIAFVIGTCAAMFEVCWLSYVPSIVERDRLVEAMGKVSASHSAAEVAGPGLGGLLVQLVSAPFALVANSVAHAAAAMSLATIRDSEPDPMATPRRRRHLRGELVEGLRFAFGDPYIRATAYTAALGNFFALIVETVFLVYAVRERDLSPGLIGLTFSAVGIGGLLGASFANALTRRFPLGRFYVVARLVSGAGALLLPLAGGSTAMLVATCMVGFFIWQAALANTNVINSSLRQALTPEHVRGRMNASVRTLVFGALPLGGLAGGALGSVIDLHTALWLGAIGYTLSVVPVLLSPLPRLRAFPEQPQAGRREVPAAR
ncbi:MFS transporter [Asanoa siamensis]|uniref:MFS transporter n=1 Tax=Asanoa siamensis TaxID=926357 RepID=A0ABQ4CP52_9ACTN|nr:MFS transporter [Asanoa siamensis]GIF73066.1 MFS transporter [Asanoa siamensis]